MAAISGPEHLSVVVKEHLFVGGSKNQFGATADNDRWPLTVNEAGEGGGWLRFTQLQNDQVQDCWQIDHLSGGLSVGEVSPPAATGAPPAAAPSRLFLQPGGNVGIGTGTPGEKLHVAGNLKVDRNIEAESLKVTQRIGATSLELSGGLSAGGDATVNGSLTVRGAQNLIKVITQTFAITNAGPDTPGNWTFPYPQPFTEVYGAFVVLQGFSFWDNKNNMQFMSHGHVADKEGRAVPQHVVVRMDSCDQNAASGVAYCSEAEKAWEVDNTILFTVVVLGRRV